MKLSTRFAEMFYQLSLTNLAFSLKADSPFLKFLRLCSVLTSRFFQKNYFSLLRRFLHASTSYSQYAQDVVIAQILKMQDDGVFVDIGANDGVQFSNSLYFEHRGWQEICVEANPKTAEKLKRNRKCKTCVAAAGSHYGKVKFLAFEEQDMLSRINGLPIDEDEALLHTLPRQEIEVEMIPTDEILLNAKSLSESGTIDYLSIDVEGAETDVLQGIDFSKHTIKAISIENNTKSFAELNILKSHGFIHILSLGCDDIFIHQNIISRTEF